MSIGRKLMLAFLLIALLSGAVACVSYFSLKKVETEFNQLESDIVPGAIKMSEMECYVNAIGNGLATYNATGENKNELQADMEALELAAKERVESATRIGPEEKAVAEEIEAKAKEYNSLVTEIISLKEQGASTEELYRKETAERLPMSRALIEQLEEHRAEHLNELYEAQDRADRAQDTATMVILFASIFMLIAAVGIGYYLSRSISRPIKTLTAAAAEIGEGEVGLQVDIRSKDEVGTLADSINKMSRDLGGALSVEKELAVTQAVAATEKDRADDLDEAYREIEKYRFLVDSTFEAIAMADLEGLYVYSNESFRKLIGLEEDDLAGKQISDYLLPAEVREEKQQEIFGALWKKGYWEGEFDVKRADGSITPVSAIASLLKDNSGNPIGRVGLFRDISERKKIEGEKEELLQSVQERVKELSCLFGLSKLVEEPGVTLEEIFQGTIELVPPSWRYPEITCTRLTVGDEDYQSDNYRETEWKQSADIMVSGTKEGALEVCYVEKVSDADEDPFIAEERDLIEALAQRLGRIVERKKMETVLRESEEKFRTIAATANDAVVMIDNEGAVSFWNRAAEEIFGYTAEEAMGKDMHGFLAAESSRDASRKGFEKFKETGTGAAVGRTLELEGLRKDGVVIPVELSLSAMQVKGKWHAVGILRDITERKKAGEELRESEERFRDLFENSSDLIQSVAPDGSYLYTNPAWKKTMGYTDEELEGLNMMDIIHPDSLEHCMQIFMKVMSGEQEREIEATFLTKDGETVLVEGNASCRFVDGEPVATRAIFRNVTEKRRIEEEMKKAREAAEAATRAKSEFLATMSHEIRTPMTGVMGMTGLLADTELNLEQQEYVSTIEDSSRVLLDVINDILDFSKIEAGRIEFKSVPFNVADTIGETVKTFALRADEKGLELVYRVKPDVPDSLIGDPDRIRQVVVNLVGNALRFTDEGEISVGVDISSWEGSEVMLHLSVADSGIGIPEEKQREIFESFTQVDGSWARKRGGTGLGLTISTRLASQMGGSVWVESEEGKGSTFHFDVRVGIEPGHVEGPGARGPLFLNGLRVLVVDDNASVRAVLEELLLAWGMKPTLVDGGSLALTALARASDSGNTFSILVADVGMEGTDGFDLVERVKEDPALAGATVLLLIGKDLKEEFVRLKEVGVSAYLTKPVTPSDLLDAIMTAIGEKEVEEVPIAVASGEDLPDSRALSVLLAEDNPVNQKLVTRLLEKKGHRVVVVGTGKEALDILEKQLFDVVLMDVQMPEVDGFEATASIREKEKETGEHMPVVAMTAHALKGDRETCLEAGMDEYLSKPINPDELYRILDSYRPPGAGPPGG